MRSTERFRKLKEWLYKELCQGRAMKAPPKDGDITDLKTAEPQVFLAWQPSQPNNPGQRPSGDPISVCPAITVMPIPSHMRYVEEHRFDRYNNIRRSQEMGQAVIVDMLMTVYDPGIRMPGFVESVRLGKTDMTLLKDGTEQGLFTLLNWMDDLMELLLREKHVPGTDLVLYDDTAVYSLYADQEYVRDKRPLYYGFVRAEFKGYASPGSDHGRPSELDKLLL